MAKKLSLPLSMKIATIAIFASGNGSNAAKIIEYFNGSAEVEIAAVFTNKTTAGVVKVAENYHIPVVFFSKEQFYAPGSIQDLLKKMRITHIVLAGFLWLIPKDLINLYDQKMINIHPALLPKFGGRGMYGRYVHEAVKNSGEKETGITIHLVNENYDEGKFLVQKKVILSGNETVDEIAAKVQELEHKYFPSSIKDWLKKPY